MYTDQFCHRGCDAHGPATQLDRRIEKEAARALFGTSVWFAFVFWGGQGGVRLRLGADVVAAGHKTSKVKINASYTRPKIVGMLSSAICAFENAYRGFSTRPDC